jgi:hypothetical protein
MGQISGVNAELITSIAGVAVANISYVGPTSAATIGLGGGGNSLKTFANFIWENTESICFQGPEIIIEVGTITLYYNQGENRMYNNEIFTEPFRGTGLYYYNQTDNQWWQISGEGYVGATGTCS